MLEEVPKFLKPIPSETMHGKQIINFSDAANLIIIPLQITRLASYFDVRKPTVEDYEDQDIVKILLMVEAPS